MSESSYKLTYSSSFDEEQKVFLKEVIIQAFKENNSDYERASFISEKFEKQYFQKNIEKYRGRWGCAVIKKDYGNITFPPSKGFAFAYYNGYIINIWCNYL